MVYQLLFILVRPPAESQTQPLHEGETLGHVFREYVRMVIEILEILVKLFIVEIELVPADIVFAHIDVACFLIVGTVVVTEPCHRENAELALCQGRIDHNAQVGVV